MAALRSLLPEHRVEIEADLAAARRDRDVLRDRLAELVDRHESPVWLAKIGYQVAVQERWISRYVGLLGGTA